MRTQWEDARERDGSVFDEKDDFERVETEEIEEILESFIKETITAYEYKPRTFWGIVRGVEFHC